MKTSSAGNITASLKKTVCVGMFCALAFIVSFLFPFKVSFLTFDTKDAIIAIGGMFFGPVNALIMSIIVPLLELATNSTTGWYGLIMNFLSSAAFSVTAALIYKYKRRISGAVISLICAIFFATAVMLLANLFITPLYAEYIGFPLDINAELPRLFLPFNLTKYIFNAAIVLLLYKPLTSALKATGLISQKSGASNQKSGNVIFTVVSAICAVLLIIGCILIYIFVLGGEFDILK